MAFAGYRFLDRGDVLDYEVQCAGCGNVYSESNVASAA